MGEKRHCLNISYDKGYFMSFRPQSGSRRSAGKQFSKSAHDKKTKEKKQRAGAKYLQDETPEFSAQEVAQRTLGSLGKLGNQIFGLSPFSQYFNEWLVTLRQVISEFESNPAINPDEAFIKERTQTFLDIEAALAENRIKENNLTAEEKELSETNHQIVEADKQYSENIRERSNKRNAEVQRLSSRIRDLEDQLAEQRQIKISFYKIGAKRKTAEKLALTNQNLKAAKNELEVTLQSFTAEQEKLHDNYEKQKQELNLESDRLHKELEKLETDTSMEARQTACNSLSTAINALLKRTPTPPKEL
jgi:DNA repair exonuclease SbcCD ATPase subunit